MRIATLIPAVLLIVSVLTQSCNKKCRSVESSYSGAITGLYDFKDCYIYAKLDSHLLIRSDSAFNAYKSSHFIHCDAAALEKVDFSQNMIIGFKTKTNACNVAFHRKVEIDQVNKTYTYTVEVERCGGCGTELASSNFVVAPQLPSGYAIRFVRKDL